VDTCTKSARDASIREWPLNIQTRTCRRESCNRRTSTDHSAIGTSLGITESNDRAFPITKKTAVFSLFRSSDAEATRGKSPFPCERLHNALREEMTKQHVSSTPACERVSRIRGHHDMPRTNEAHSVRSSAPRVMFTAFRIDLRVRLTCIQLC
jgi:hypothetical protein